MNIFLKIMFFCALIGCFTPCQSQTTLTNDDALISIENNAYIYVEGNVLIKSTGVIDNSGTMFVQNDWTNNSAFNVFLNSSPGTVSLFGTNQNIGGSTPTLFYNLVTENLAEKSLYVDTWVENMLNIKDAEIQIHDNVLHLRNPHPDSLLWNSGFVSGDSLGGYLNRSTNKLVEYIFPVGDLGLINTYRAVALTPTSSDSSVFGVRLAGINSDVDNTGVSNTGSVGSFPRTQAEPRALVINEKFYHNISRFHGTSNVSSKIFYFQSDEPSFHDFNNIAIWKNSIPRWVIGNQIDVSTSTYLNVGNPYKYMSGTISDFSNDVYSLTVRDKDDVFVPQIFSPNGDGINDILKAYANRLSSMELVIYNRLGERVFETKNINIGWDGKFRGKDAQSGVYVYYLTGNLKGGGAISKKGDITLVR